MKEQEPQEQRHFFKEKDQMYWMPFRDGHIIGEVGGRYIVTKIGDEDWYDVEIEKHLFFQDIQDKNPQKP